MSEVSFPIKDLTRRKTQTTLTFIGLTISFATTIFLAIFADNLGFDIGFLSRGGQLSNGFSGILYQFVLIVTALNMIIGPLVTSFLVNLTMSERMKDIGIMKSSGCLSNSVLVYFLTELSLLVLASAATGIILGLTSFFAVSIFLNSTGFQISQNVNIVAVAATCVILIVSSHFFGALPIRKAAKARPAEAMSPIFLLGTMSGTAKRIPSRLGLTFKIAFRNLIRRPSGTIQAILCLTVVLTLTTVAIAGGMISNQTTSNYVERAIGENVVIVGHTDVTEHYVGLLSKFYQTIEPSDFDFLDSSFEISTDFVSNLEQISGVSIVDPRLIFETTVHEGKGVVYDGITQTNAVIIGGDRSDSALVLGVDPEKVVNNWMILGEKLGVNEQKVAMIGNSLAASMYSDVLNQRISLIEKNGHPYDNVGVCVDPLNSGKVVYVPLESLQNQTGKPAYNILFLQTDPAANAQVLSDIQEFAIQNNMTAVNLNQFVSKSLSFLNKTWSVVMFLPLFSLVTAAVSLFSYMMLAVSGQEHEFGIMRALGAKPFSVIKIVFAQALVIILVSGLIGISLGLLMSFEFLIPSPTSSQSTLISVTVGLFCVICVISASALYPSLHSIKKTALEAISSTS
ncbi:MAG: FtsX-like permease family protein [Candidatus Bathyarchaeota archaeon]|nr:FtsX-like permease family protein [Candidatus Bathyarchaeota archaeon]